MKFFEEFQNSLDKNIAFVLKSDHLDNHNRVLNLETFINDFSDVFNNHRLRTYEAFAGDLHQMASNKKDVGSNKKLLTNQVGCIVSHLSIWRTVLSEIEQNSLNDRDFVLVFENDSRFTNKDISYIKSLMDVDLYIYDFLYIDNRDFRFLCSQHYDKSFINENWYVSEMPLCTNAYAMRVSLIKKVILGKSPFLTLFDQPLDWLILRFLKQNNIHYCQLEKSFLGLADLPSTIMP